MKTLVAVQTVCFCSFIFVLQPSLYLGANCDIHCNTGCFIPPCDVGCVAGWGLNASFYCGQCDPNCLPTLSCNSNGPEKCDGNCITGYGINTTSHTCGPCDIHCVNTSACNLKGPGTCGGNCVAGYGINATSRQCGTCDIHCLPNTSCNTNGPGKCDVGCNAGYTLSSSTHICMLCHQQCAPNVGCTTPGTCMGLCNLGYARDSYNICVPCDSNCIGICSTDGPGYCDNCTTTNCGCKAGYTLVSDTTTPTKHVCAACDVNCNKTSSGCAVKGAYRCDSFCNNGYALNTTSYTCKACGTNCVGGCTVQGQGYCDGPCASGYALKPALNMPSKTACYPA